MSRAEATGKTKNGVSTTTKAADFSVSSFDAASVANPSAQAKAARQTTQTAAQTPSVTSGLLSATPISQQVSLKAPQLTTQALSPTPMGPVAKLQTPVANPALSPTPIAQQVALTAPQLTTRMLSATPLGPVSTFKKAGDLPEPAALNLTNSVGTGGANLPSDVRQIQDRLNDLGYLSDADYEAEKADPTQTEALQEANLERTIEAIRDFQKGVVGGVDGNIGPTGATVFSLRDPTYGTQTTINANAADAAAGVPMETFALSPEVQAIVRAVETVESGTGKVGEIPAQLRNASGTPASFGKGQLVGGTAVGVLSQYPEVARAYGLDAAEVQALNTIARQTTTTYNDILASVPRGGLTEAQLQERIAEYTQTQGATVREQTGLQDADIENMFRAAQLKQQLRGYSDVDTALANADIAANFEALGLRNSDLRTYINNPDFHGEHRQGFVTRALFSSENGQALRNAMTDNSGLPLGRGLIQDNYNSVISDGARYLGRPLTAAEAAEATMLVHNRGMGALNDLLDSFGDPGRRIDRYVQHAMPHWTPVE